MRYIQFELTRFCALIYNFCLNAIYGSLRGSAQFINGFLLITQHKLPIFLSIVCNMYVHNPKYTHFINRVENVNQHPSQKLKSKNLTNKLGSKYFRNCSAISGFWLVSGWARIKPNLKSPHSGMTQVQCDSQAICQPKPQPPIPSCQPKVKMLGCVPFPTIQAFHSIHLRGHYIWRQQLLSSVQ